MLKKLWLKGYRNLKECVIDLENKKEVFVFGANNQGKTNFLESLYFAGNGVSPVESDIKNIINFQEKEAFIGIDFVNDSESKRLYVKLTNDGRKQFFFDKKKINSLSLLGQQLNIDFISADIIRIFTESPEFRRKELDRFCSKDLYDYSIYLKQYEKVIKQRNNLIKRYKNARYNSKSKIAKPDLVIWNEKLVQLAEKIVNCRHLALDKISNQLKEVLIQITSLKVNTLDIRYIYNGFDEIDHINYKEKLKYLLEKYEDNEYKTGYSLFGPHRDDFFIKINNRDLFLFFSKGINRMVAILFRVSQLKILDIKCSNFPVLLLDDAFAELDDLIKSDLVKVIGKYAQMFYTSVIKSDKRLFDNVTVYEMNKGELVNE